MKREEIQNLIREAFELGCSQGRAEYQISDYCTSLVQEQILMDSVGNEQSEFETRTGFKLK